MTASYRVQVDWDNDGDFGDTGEDVTSRTLDRSGLAAEYGRDHARAMSPPAPGRATFELDNRSYDYSPENDSSPLAGLVLPARPVLIDAELASTTHTLFRGQLDDFDLMPGEPVRSVAVSCVDGLAALVGVRLSTPVHHAVRTGEAIGLILDAAGWPDDKRDLDIGASTIRWWWEEGTDAWDAVKKVVAAEGEPALLFLGPDGEIVFRDRHHRLTRSASLTSQATLRPSGTEPLFSTPLVYDHGWRDIANVVELEASERSPSGSAVVVWEYDRPVAIADGETVEIVAGLSDPVVDAITPAEDTDYIVRSGTVSVSLSRDSGAAIAVRVTASGGSAVVDSLQLRAYPLPVVRRIVVSSADPESVENFGHRKSDIDATWLNVHDALAVAEVAVARRATRLPVVHLRLVSGNDTRLTQQLTRDLSDRITIVESIFGLNDDFFIERISHRVGAAGRMHETTFGCEKALEQIDGVFRFDTAGQGFDDGKFGRTGLDDPDLMFRFDTAGQGFDDGVFAT